MIWVQLIAQYGIPAAYKIWADWKDKNEPTQADWDALIALVNKPLEDYEKPKSP